MAGRRKLQDAGSVADSLARMARSTRMGEQARLYAPVLRKPGAPHRLFEEIMQEALDAKRLRVKLHVLRDPLRAGTPDDHPSDQNDVHYVVSESDDIGDFNAVRLAVVYNAQLHTVVIMDPERSESKYAAALFADRGKIDQALSRAKDIEKQELDALRSFVHRTFQDRYQGDHNLVLHMLRTGYAASRDELMAALILMNLDPLAIVQEITRRVQSNLE